MLFEGPKHKHLKQSIYRGVGGSGNATDDATIAEVSTLASNAANSASAAAASETAAASSASGASASATQAATSASNAASSATSAASSASSAASSVSTAAAEASAAASSAAAAAVSAGQASTSATNAANSASTSASARDSAETYMLAAQTAETNAETAYANTLAIYGNTTDVAAAVSAASGSASSAASSASAAASSASSASTSATNAASSATAALASQNAAASSASNAASTASNITALFNDLDAVNTAVALSEGYKNDAGASAVSAAASASSASTSATNAASSATQAAASAASASAIVLGVASGLPDIAPTLNLDFSNSKVLDPRITFTRASEGRYYDGKTVAKAEENLLTSSNVWYGGQNISQVSSTETAPNGTATAFSFAENTATAFHILQANSVAVAFISGNVYTFSIHAKAGTSTVIQFAPSSSAFGSVHANFDLLNGVVGTASAGVTHSIQSLGNGWYRCIATVTATTSASVAGTQWAFTNNNASASRLPAYAGDTAQTLLYWGAQVEQRSSVTAYTPTTTQAITNYIPVLQTAAAGVARFDHNPVTGESLGLLIEEQRTNLLTRSQEFDNAAWTKQFTTVTANAVVAPDGTLTADKLIATAVNNGHWVSQNGSITAGATVSFSVFVKAAEIGAVAISVVGTGRWAGVKQLNLVTGAGTVFSNTYTLSSYSSVHVGNGWYRVNIVVVTSTDTALNCRIYPDTDAAYTGDGYSGIYIWGAQLE